jgi:hypothetical protein
MGNSGSIGGLFIGKLDQKASKLLTMAYNMVTIRQQRARNLANCVQKSAI